MSCSSTILNNPNGKQQAGDKYESIEFSLANGQSNYNLDTNQVTYKSILPEAFYLRILSTKTITVKFNEASNHAITVLANETAIFDRQQFKNVFLTNTSGESADIRMYIK